MKISQSTLAILKNYATINTNILVRKGKTLATLAIAKNIFSVAEVEEEFPREFAIYDLNALLSLLTLEQDLDIDFGEKSLKITSKDGGEFEFFYSDPSIFTAIPPEKRIPVAPFFEFKMTHTEITALLKAAAIVSAPTLSFVAKNGKVESVVSDPSTPGSNTFRRTIGETDLTFNAMIDVERFKVIPDSYNVVINQKFVYLKSQTKTLEYWLAVNPSSQVG